MTRAISLFALVFFALFTVVRPCSDNWAAPLSGVPADRASADGYGIETTGIDCHHQESICHRLQDTLVAEHQVAVAPPGSRFETPLPALPLRTCTPNIAATPAKNAATYNSPPSAAPLYLRHQRLLI